MKHRNKHGFFAITAALLAGAASVHPVQAAELRYARGEVVGSGPFEISNNRNRNERSIVKKLNIAFEQNRTFDIRFTPTNSNTFNISGTWARRSDDAVSFIINDGGGNGTYSGSGTLYFRIRNGERQPSILRFTGQRINARRVANFELKFDASGVGNYSSSWQSSSSESREIVQLFTTKNGNGRVEINNQRDSNLRRAKLELNRNGDARIELTGNRTYVFEGTWSSDGLNRIRLRLDSASSIGRSSSRWLGSGNVILRNNAFDRLDLSGNLGRDRFTVIFNAN